MSEVWKKLGTLDSGNRNRGSEIEIESTGANLPSPYGCGWGIEELAETATKTRRPMSGSISVEDAGERERESRKCGSGSEEGIVEAVDGATYSGSRSVASHPRPIAYESDSESGFHVHMRVVNLDPPKGGRRRRSARAREQVGGEKSVLVKMHGETSDGTKLESKGRLRRAWDAWWERRGWIAPNEH